MILKQKMFRKVAIIGVGFMGGSVGMAIKKYDLAKEVAGFSHKQSSLVQAMKNHAIDSAFADIAQAVKNADLIVLATPVESIIKLFSVINPFIRRGCVITDMGSAKDEIVESAEKILANPHFFIGSHPLVGSEKKGVENARADLFENSECMITPTEKTNQVAKVKVRYLWTKIGAKVKEISPKEHDSLLSEVSHLPHLAAFALMNAIPKESMKFALQGLKDTTRIAASNPQMWSDICLMNRRNIIKALDKYVESLSDIRKEIIERNDAKLIKLFTEAKEKREMINQTNSQGLKNG